MKPISPRDLVPITHWFQADKRAGLGNDVLAGVPVWARVIPQAIVYCGCPWLPGALMLEASWELDVSGVDGLETLRRDLDELGSALRLTNVHPEAREMFSRSSLADIIDFDVVHARE